MAKIIFNVLFKIIIATVNTILLPINGLVSTLFPNFSSLITTFTLSVSVFINSTFTWFINILPPYTKTAIIVYITFLISYYTISITLHYILKVFQIIRNIKWSGI